MTNGICDQCHCDLPIESQDHRQYCGECNYQRRKGHDKIQRRRRNFIKIFARFEKIAFQYPYMGEVKN